MKDESGRRIKVDKGIPIPNNRKKYAYVGNAIARMKVGDSIVLLNEQEVNHARTFARIRGYRLITRSLQKGEGNRRVWLKK